MSKTKTYFGQNILQPYATYLFYFVKGFQCNLFNEKTYPKNKKHLKTCLTILQRGSAIYIEVENKSY